jgi:hypothetical protein
LACSFNKNKITSLSLSNNVSVPAVASAYHHTDPVSYFNYHCTAYALKLLEDKGWKKLKNESTENRYLFVRPGKTKGGSASWGYKNNSLYIFTSSAPPFEPGKYYTAFQILVLLRFYGNNNAAQTWIQRYYLGEETPYLRVGTDYYKSFTKADRYGMNRLELKPWRKEEISQDHGKKILNEIPLYDDFTIVPSNIDYQSVISNCYNLYKPFHWQPEQGSWEWTENLLKHIFGEQYHLGLRYMQALYLHPDKMLPILVLVSKERQTGKTTMVNWLNMIFGDNMVIIGPEDLTNGFNHIYATSNIIAVEETLIEKAITVEKIKSLATGKFITVNQKFVSQYKVPFFGKIILASNNEDKFARIDEEEIRFFIRKVERPKNYNHGIEELLLKEIPAFLYYLKTLPPIDWSVDRSGFTPEEISNQSLDNVKRESKTGLFKDLNELFKEHFNNNETLNELYCSPIDIKDKWFNHDNSISRNYIISVMKNEFKLVPSDKIVRYNPFETPDYTYPSKTGKPYCIKRNYFFVDEESSILSF